MKTKRYKNKIKYFIIKQIKKIVGGYKRGGLLGMYHYIRCHLWNRYHIINISGCGLYKWGWIDRDWVLLYANFRILEEFIEKENPHIPNKDDINYSIDKDLREIYNWWKYERKIEWDSNQLNNKNYNEYNNRFEELCEKDNEMLHRLINVRRYLWS